MILIINIDQDTHENLESIALDEHYRNTIAAEQSSSRIGESAEAEPPAETSAANSSGAPERAAQQNEDGTREGTPEQALDPNQVVQSPPITAPEVAQEQWPLSTALTVADPGGAAAAPSCGINSRNADIVVFYATSPGKKAFRNPEHGIFHLKRLKNLSQIAFCTF